MCKHIPCNKKLSVFILLTSKQSSLDANHIHQVCLVDLNFLSQILFYMVDKLKTVLISGIGKVTLGQIWLRQRFSMPIVAFLVSNSITFEVICAGAKIHKLFHHFGHFLTK